MLVNDFNVPLFLSWVQYIPKLWEHCVYVNRCFLIEGLASKQWDINIFSPIQKWKAVVGMKVYSVEWSNTYGVSRITNNIQVNMDKATLINHSLDLVFLALNKGYISHGLFLLAYHSQIVIFLVNIRRISLLLYSNIFSVTLDLRGFEWGMVTAKPVRNICKPPLGILSYNSQVSVPFISFGVMYSQALYFM